MPDPVVTDEFTVAGEVPLFSDPFAMDSFGLTDYLGGLSLNEYAQRQNEAFLAPLPELLPEFVVEPPPPAPRPVVPLPGVVTSTAGALLTGLVALLFPQPTGPREFDEAPGGAGQPPNTPPPGGTDPIMPPNWEDLISEPFPTTRPGPPLTPLPMTPIPPPVLLDEFEVNPPPRTTFSDPLLYFGDNLITPSDFPTPVSPFETEVPYELQPLPEPVPGIKLDPTDLPGIGPGSAPAPFGTPGSDPFPGLPDPFVDPGVSPRPGPTGEPTPDPSRPPLPDPIGDPIGDPLATPPLPDGTGPRTGTPGGGSNPLPFADNVTPEPDLLDPLEQFGPDRLQPEDDTCSCAKKPKKKAKKRKDRDVCYRGTYRQLKRGITYKKLEEVPCEAKAPKEKTARKPRKRTPTWKDTVDEVFGRLI